MLTTTTQRFGRCPRCGRPDALIEQTIVEIEADHRIPQDLNVECPGCGPYRVQRQRGR